MKKILLLLIVLFIFVFCSSPVFAMTAQERQVLIYQIRLQIAQLQQQLLIEMQREKAGPGTVKIYGPDKKTGTISAIYGDNINISWEAKNVDSCFASGNWSGSKSIIGSESTGFLNSSRVYNISCKDYSGKIATAVLTINVVMPEVNIKAGSLKLLESAIGKKITLNWTAKGVKNCWAFGDWQGDKNLTGSESTGYLNYPRVYNYGISCNSNKGVINDTAQINVVSPFVNIKANSSDGPISIDRGKSVSLKWTSSGIVSCTALGSWSGSKNVSGSQTMSNIVTQSFYVLNCIDANGNTIGDSVTVNMK